MNITCKCHSTPYLIAFIIIITAMVAFSAYVLTQYGWETCNHTHDLFKQSIISIFNSIITGILMVYIIIMPERGHPGYDNGLIKFGIGYLLQTIIVFVNTYLFFESGIYYLINAKYSDCNKLYYYTIYTNVILGCLPTIYAYCIFCDGFYYKMHG